MQTINTHPCRKNQRGQSMVEFALAFPIFLLLVLGIFEFGRLFVTYSSVYLAAREGARFGAAVDNVVTCGSGIETEARRVGFIADDQMSISHTYDHGPGTSVFTCATGGSNVGLGDRVLVTASINDFKSITGIFPPIDIQSRAQRTVIKQVYLGWTPAPQDGGTGGTPIPTNTIDPNYTPPATSAPTDTPTVTPTTELLMCQNNWNAVFGQTHSTDYVNLSFNNPYADGLYSLNSITIAWNASGNRWLENIGIDPPPTNGVYKRLWQGKQITSPFTLSISPPESLLHGISIVQFTFEKESTIDEIEMTFTDSNGNSCYINYVRP